jgi:predicted dienelactone hydrolase
MRNRDVIRVAGFCRVWSQKMHMARVKRAIRVLGAALAVSALSTSLGLSQPALKDGAVSDSYKVGLTFRSFVPKEPYDWRDARDHALNVVVWYPTDATARDKPLVIRGLDIFELGRVAQDAPLAAKAARFPLVVISHGSGGSALTMAWLGAALAAHGYIVAAVNHPGNNAGEPYTAKGFSIWWERARDLSETISGMLADAKFGDQIDPERIGSAGFSLGGYAMIEIAGGLTDVQAFIRFCDSPNPGVSCASPPEFPSLVEDFRKLIREHPEVLQNSADSFRDSRVRAVFAMAPGLGPAMPASGLKTISIPVQIVAGESDQYLPIALNAKHFAAQIPGSKLHIFPGNVAHYVFLDSCTEVGRKSVPMLCTDAQGVDRDAIHADTVRRAVQFFRATLEPKSG